jgi:3-phosphoshikimate 1-carboxyvinyltransferase
MRRLVEPLRRMGAEIEDTDGHAPLTVTGRPLRGAVHELNVASAQVKSALLLAGLTADGPTTVDQPGPARDHTERMLAAMGTDIQSLDLTVTLHPATRLVPISLCIPGDISSAAFLLVAATLVPGSEVTISGVGINPTRTGLLDVLRAMGAEISIDNQHTECGESIGDLTARAADLRGVTIEGDTVVRMIDEFPVLAVAATQARGTTVVRDAKELRVKETDRIAAVVQELSRLGAQIEAREDGFVVEGPTFLHGGAVDSHGDHRLAMALTVAGLVSSDEVVIQDVDCIEDSFPGFVERMRTIGANCD